MPSETQEITFMPSTIETIDTGFYEFINNKMDLHSETNSGWKKTPVVWVSPERSFQIKNDKSLRDSAGRIKLPIITVERKSMAKDPTFKGSIQAHMGSDGFKERGYRGGAFRVAKRIVQSKTRNFASADVKRKKGDIDSPNVGDGQDHFPSSNKKIVYEEILVPVPTYITVMYSIRIRTEYQQQFNELITPFITRTGQLNHFVFIKDNHKYEAFIQQDFGHNNNVANMGEDERSFEATIEVKVLGYLIGEGKNDPRPKVIKRESIVEVKLIRERVIVGDKKPWITDNPDANPFPDDGDYRQ